MRNKRHTPVKYSLMLTILMMGISSCITTDIPESELPNFVDKIVVNASLDNINKIDIEISNSAWAYNSDLPEIVGDAELILSNSTGEIPLTYNSSTKTYQNNSPGVIGETYVLIASRKEYQTIRTSCVIPSKVVGKTSGFIENGGTDIDGNPSDKLFMRFTDPVGKNYYTLHFYYYSNSAKLFIQFEFQNTDATLLSASTLELNDGGYLFRDDLFDGSEKEFSVVAPRGLVAGNPDVKYLIELRSVSEDYFKYQTTLQQYSDQQDSQNNGPFGSAVIVHSNISNGLGVFLSSSLESDTLR